MDRVSAAVIELIDLRETPLEDLPERVQLEWTPPATLILSRRPSNRWMEGLNFARPLRLSSAPLYELVLWVSPEALPELPPELQQEHQELLRGYHALFREDGDVEAYLGLLEQHIRYQETQLFATIGAALPIERALRELGYEHRGLEKGAARVRDAVAQHRRGELEKKARDRLDLDFYHLLEHHIERERDALLPAWSFLQKNLKKG